MVLLDWRHREPDRVHIYHDYSQLLGHGRLNVHRWPQLVDDIRHWNRLPDRVCSRGQEGNLHDLLELQRGPCLRLLHHILLEDQQALVLHPSLWLLPQLAQFYRRLVAAGVASIFNQQQQTRRSPQELREDRQMEQT